MQHVLRSTDGWMDQLKQGDRTLLGYTYGLVWQQRGDQPREIPPCGGSPAHPRLRRDSTALLSISPPPFGKGSAAPSNKILENKKLLKNSGECFKILEKN